jgi:hypothetical protein
MKKSKKEVKTTKEPKGQIEKTPRREFLSRTGRTAGGVLIGSLAAGGISEGAQSTTQQRLLNPDVFRRLFDQALTDKEFQNDILARGFKALDARGYQHGVPVEVQATLESSLLVSVGEVAKPKCGVCGVCGLCGLCGEINLGSASAALWALFALA